MNRKMLEGEMIYCEQCRVKQAQQPLTESILKRMSGRVVVAQDREVFEQLEKSNKQSRKKLFGCEHWLWYLKGPFDSRGECVGKTY